MPKCVGTRQARQTATDDADVGKFLRLFTDLSLDIIGRLESLPGAEINDAKVVLATEATTLLHGRDAALNAKATAQATFGAGGIGGELPTLATDDSNLPIVSILIGLGFVDSKAEARRKIGEGAVRVNGEVVSDPMSVVTTDAEPVKISLGKKKHGLLTRS